MNPCEVTVHMQEKKKVQNVKRKLSSQTYTKIQKFLQLWLVVTFRQLLLINIGIYYQIHKGYFLENYFSKIFIKKKYLIF